MAAMTYYVALAFKRSEDGGDIIACDPKEDRRSDQRRVWPARWRRWRGIGGPSRSLGPAIRLLATSRTL